MRRSVPWLALCLIAPASSASLETGMAAVEKRDWAAAVAAFRPLAEQNVAAAQVNLGNLYMKGWGVEQDYHAAFRWYLKAATQGDALGQNKLGVLHYYGLGVEEDHAEAARWFREAAEQGEPGAQAILGSLYAHGDGVTQDRVQAYLWLSLAAEREVEGVAEQREALAEAMTPGELEEALTRLAEWRQRHDPKPAIEEGNGGKHPTGRRKSGRKRQ